MTRGPQPKATAVRRNKHPTAATLAALPQPGRELPRGLGITTAGARRFWRVWSTAPQTSDWVETDWAELEITTRLVDALYMGDLRQAAEIRQRTAKWGGTVEDRARLRMKLETPEEDQGQAAELVAAADQDAELFRLLTGEGG